MFNSSFYYLYFVELFIAANPYLAAKVYSDI